jgi:hypothetical protein
MMMVHAGELRPGDVLDDGTLIVNLEGRKATTQHFRVLRPNGKLGLASYGFAFNLLRRPREGEEHPSFATSCNLNPPSIEIGPGMNRNNHNT